MPCCGRIRKFLVELVVFRAQLRLDPILSREEREAVSSQLSQLIVLLDERRRGNHPFEHRLNPRSAGDYFPRLDGPPPPGPLR